MSNPENLKPFKPGQCGNPNGRPKGRRSLSTILREMLSEEIEIDVNGKKTKKELQDVIVNNLIQNAVKGDLRAIEQIFNRTEGTPIATVRTQEIDKDEVVVI